VRELIAKRIIEAATNDESRRFLLGLGISAYDPQRSSATIAFCSEAGFAPINALV
jgi:hypothetical protein